MRDDQVRRYAHHILLPDVGGLGQTALLVAAARLELRESEPDAELIAAQYLAAGGVGTIEIRGASDEQIERLAAHGPDTMLATEQAPHAGRTVELVLHPRPAWWPSAPGDAIALAYWRGALAATQWMAAIANA
jgi:hypothetical protein